MTNTTTDTWWTVTRGPDCGIPTVMNHGVLFALAAAGLVLAYPNVAKWTVLAYVAILVMRPK